MEDISFLSLLLNASFIVKLVMILLVALSILGWTIIVAKYRELNRMEKKNRFFTNAFKSTQDLDNLYNQLSIIKSTNGLLANLFLTAHQALQKGDEQSSDQAFVIEQIERQTDLFLSEQSVGIRRYVSWLATIGSVSPYIGLFGTVWGIMNAFIGLSAVQQTTIATVAPGIAEALVATAMGLLAAIPALVAYNLLTERINQVITSGEHFVQSFINLVDRS